MIAVYIVTKNMTDSSTLRAATVFVRPERLKVP